MSEATDCHTCIQNFLTHKLANEALKSRRFDLKKSLGSVQYTQIATIMYLLYTVVSLQKVREIDGFPIEQTYQGNRFIYCHREGLFSPFFYPMTNTVCGPDKCGAHKRNILPIDLLG